MPSSLFPDPRPHAGSRSVERTTVGRLGSTDVSLFHLDTGVGVAAQVLGYGATLASLYVPDRRGQPGPVVLGFDGLEGYLTDRSFVGATVGRFANRIADGNLLLDGKRHVLPQSDGGHHLHGGPGGFHTRVFEGVGFRDGETVGVRFTRTSPDGEEGYPGNLEVSVTYRLSASGDLSVEYTARTDAPTVVSLAPHAYFNLRDGGQTSVLDHRLTIPAHRVLEVDRSGIPTGGVARVDEGPLDFRRERRIRDRFSELVLARGGYDHPFVFDASEGAPRELARLYDPSSGRRMTLAGTAACLQLYTGQFLPPGLDGRGGVRLGPCSGLCLEPQAYPDAPHHAAFPSARLDPGETWHRAVVYAFDAA